MDGFLTVIITGAIVIAWTTWLELREEQRGG